MMNPRVKAVSPLKDYRLELVFTNDETRIFDAKPYLEKGVFQELKRLDPFHSVKPYLGSIQWKNSMLYTVHCTLYQLPTTNY